MAPVNTFRNSKCSHENWPRISKLLNVPTTLKKTESFSYMGSTISSNGRIQQELQRESVELGNFTSVRDIIWNLEM